MEKMEGIKVFMIIASGWLADRFWSLAKIHLSSMVLHRGVACANFIKAYCFLRRLLFFLADDGFEPSAPLVDG